MMILFYQAEKKEKTVEEVTTLGRKLAEGEEYFAVAHIFASFNDTFVVSTIQFNSQIIILIMSVLLFFSFPFFSSFSTLPIYPEEKPYAESLVA